MKSATLTDLGETQGDRHYRFHLHLEDGGMQQGLPVFDLEGLYWYLADFFGKPDFNGTILVRVKAKP